MFREHHEADSFAIRGYAPDADPMNELPPNAGAKRSSTGPFRAFSYLTRSALANAASIASLLLTTETLVVEKKEDEEDK